jgi:hypothetical protein
MSLKPNKLLPGVPMKVYLLVIVLSLFAGEASQALYCPGPLAALSNFFLPKVKVELPLDTLDESSLARFQEIIIVYKKGTKTETLDKPNGSPLSLSNISFNEDGTVKVTYQFMTYNKQSALMATNEVVFNKKDIVSVVGFRDRTADKKVEAFKKFADTKTPVEPGRSVAFFPNTPITDKAGNDTIAYFTVYTVKDKIVSGIDPNTRRVLSYDLNTSGVLKTNDINIQNTEAENTRIAKETFNTWTRGFYGGPRKRFGVNGPTPSDLAKLGWGGAVFLVRNLPGHGDGAVVLFAAATGEPLGGDYKPTSTGVYFDRLGLEVPYKNIAAIANTRAWSFDQIPGQITGRVTENYGRPPRDRIYRW